MTRRSDLGIVVFWWGIVAVLALGIWLAVQRT
jgi:hypothetical protein